MSERPTPHHYMNADGFCHAGDMFEQGTDFTVLYSADELVRIVNAEKAEAWDEAHARFCDYAQIEKDANLPHPNPYRVTPTEARKPRRRVIGSDGASRPERGQP